MRSSQLHSSIAKLSFTEQQIIKEEVKKPSKQPLLNRSFIKLLVPPFFIYIITQIWRFVSKNFTKSKNFLISIKKRIFQQDNDKEKSDFNRRTYEEHLEELKLDQSQLGFTNQVLYQQSKKTVNLYLPVYVTCKIKSIQDVSVQDMTGNISCTMIINVFYGDIPEEVVQKLQKSMIVQMNRGDAMRLKDDDDDLTITMKRDNKKKFIVFTIRRIFLAALVEDTLWSPFQVLQLIISFTFNTVSIVANQIKKISETSQFKPEKQYKISFNNMRNNDQIPISYALDCVFGIYDLAEKKLETYHSRLGSYGQIIRNFEEHQLKIKRKKKGSKDHKSEKEKDKKDKGKQTKNKQQKVSNKNESLDTTSLLALLTDSTMKRLSVRPSKKHDKKEAKKVKYFQYAHFIIPLYKLPGNALSTIFIPIFLLALVSLSIFFQQPQLSGRIGSIATMILGYIALIPSIKQQLPPSSQLTVIQAVVYIQTLCCLLCLYESWQVVTQDTATEFKFIWQQNFAFLLCLYAHIETFVFIIGLFIVHKLKWQPSYNHDEKIIEIKPADNIEGWDNPFCDEVFIKFNKDIATGKYTDKERSQMIIKPYPIKQNQKKKDEKHETKAKQGKQGKQENNQNPIFNLFSPFKSEMQNPTKQNDKQERYKQQKIYNHIEEEYDQFVSPDPQLYYTNKKEKVK